MLLKLMKKLVIYFFVLHIFYVKISLVLITYVQLYSDLVMLRLVKLPKKPTDIREDYVLAIFEHAKSNTLMLVGSTVIIILDYDFGLNKCMRAAGGGQALIHNAFVNIGRGQLVTEYESITVIILQTPSTTYHFNAMCCALLLTTGFG